MLKTKLEVVTVGTPDITALSDDERRVFFETITLLVKKIRLFDDKMIIIYNTPKTISLDESQGFSFYTDNVPYPIHIQNVQEPRMIDFQLIMRI